MSQTVAVVKSHKSKDFIDCAQAVDCIEKILSYMIGQTETVRILRIRPQFVPEEPECLGENFRPGENLGIRSVNSSNLPALGEKRIPPRQTEHAGQTPREMRWGFHL